ncbi:hypothetical protein H7X46_07615 [Pseudonocardia sp. C8]|uniref:hypothetical protein n=1 Tax=Pseudonocardia sp. C8 TaxID=2762759 RepID=UPI001642E5AD|nr:hypothetical protein [Pseudonocardia sp. C8]MBC3190928.1 hypothetical protein [Pseudonocardia sp. C8]
MSVFGEPSEQQRRVWRVRDLVRSLAVEWFAATEVREPVGDTAITRPVLADPLAGLRAAVLSRWVAAGQVRDYALDARGAGRSWAEVASVLGFDDHDAPGVVAFEHVAERGGRTGPRWDRVWWRCASCGQRVADTGPYSSHPSEVETGHAETCARHAADVAAWAERTGWGQ